MTSCSPEELQKKSQELLAKWQACQAQPGFDGLVEFAVTVSSLTEFLEARGLSGLHQSAHALEQRVRITNRPHFTGEKSIIVGFT